MFNIHHLDLYLFQINYYGKTGFPFVTLRINQLQLTNENTKSIIQNSSRNNNFLILFAENFIQLF